MVDLTLLRIDVDVESITADAKAYAPFSKSVDGNPPDDGDGVDGSGGATVEVERGGGTSRVKVGLAAALVGLVFLLVAGLVLRRYVTEGDEAEAEVETPEVAIE
jgi:hypothetical protein